MSNKKPEWEELEIIVTEVQKQLAPDAVIQHNHRVMGKSGRRRKLDVTISEKISSFPIFIVFDCKHHSTPVRLKDVAAFSVQLEDVGATLGVMVSSSGFDAGAKAIAREKRIILQTFRKAGETDWNRLLGENAWSVLTAVLPNQVHILGFPHASRIAIELPFDTPILDENGEHIDYLNSVFWSAWSDMGKPIGDINGQVVFDGATFFIKKDDELTQIQGITITAKLTAKKYLVNLHMAGGTIIEEENKDKPVYQSVVSQGFDWAEILTNQTGVEITNEEYQKLLREAQLFVPLNNAKRYIRLVAEDKGKHTP